MSRAFLRQQIEDLKKARKAREAREAREAWLRLKAKVVGDMDNVEKFLKNFEKKFLEGKSDEEKLRLIKKLQQLLKQKRPVPISIIGDWPKYISYYLEQTNK